MDKNIDVLLIVW